MRAASFTCDATPPIGHPLCGGWITPAKEIVDRQFCHGVVLVPDDQEPIVLCAVDWCWIRGEAHRAWRERIAQAVKTQPNRVSLHCVHQHDALMADVAADQILSNVPLDLRTLKGPFFEETIARSAESAKAAMTRLRAVTHIGTGQAKVEKVAGNRRVLGPDGKVKYWRSSACKDPAARAQPEGLIDPWLKCITLLEDGECIAALHYYATHPMSHYGQGGVSSDFVGLARERLRTEQGIPHIFFNGCAGNISAGKYNDGSPGMRPLLSERIHAAMKGAFEQVKPEPLARVSWAAHPMHLPMSHEFTRTYFERKLHDDKGKVADRIKGAMGVAWWDWYDAGEHIDVTALHLGDVHILHLPAEAFIEYQLYAQQFGAYLAGPRSNTTTQATTEPASTTTAELKTPFIAVAAYGDCGPAYIPVAEAYPQGGYEVGMAWVGPEAEAILKAGIREVLLQGAA